MTRGYQIFPRGQGWYENYDKIFKKSCDCPPDCPNKEKEQCQCTNVATVEK